MDSGSDLLAGLMRAADKMAGPPLTIDGMSAEDAAAMVDLKVAYTPIVMESWGDERDRFQIPQPVKVQRDGLRYAAIWPERHDFEWLDNGRLRVCRARFLLMRGFFYKNFRTYSHPEQQKILVWYFGGQMWQPKAGSELAVAMGIL